MTIEDFYSKLLGRNIKTSKLIPTTNSSITSSRYEYLPSDFDIKNKKTYEAKRLRPIYTCKYDFDPEIDLNDPDYIFYTNKKVTMSYGDYFQFDNAYVLDIYYEDENLKDKEVTDIYQSAGLHYFYKLKKGSIFLPTYFNIYGSNGVKSKSHNNIVLDLIFYYLRDSFIDETRFLQCVYGDMSVSNGTVVLKRDEPELSIDEILEKSIPPEKEKENILGFPVWTSFLDNYEQYTHIRGYDFNYENFS